jgi:asparagine synthase (glutamine-hydrolysing)
MDIATMAHGLEARSPFLDHKVLELAASISATHKIPWLTTKALLRRTYKNILPRAVARGRKRGFEIPAARWLRGHLRPLVHDRVLSPTGRLSTYCRTERLRQLVAEHETGRRDHANRIWALLCLGMWLDEN